MLAQHALAIITVKGSAFRMRLWGVCSTMIPCGRLGDMATNYVLSFLLLKLGQHGPTTVAMLKALSYVFGALRILAGLGAFIS